VRCAITAIDTDAVSRWLPLRSQTNADALPLFCLPHAGGGASAFRTWLYRVPGVAVLPVQPPGRESRFREPAYERMGPLIEELATVVLDAVDQAEGRSYAVYGHSLGALAAFELLRELRRRGAAEPVHLFVSGCVAPHLTYDDGPSVATAPLPELVQMLRRLGGTPEWLLSDQSAMEMVLPAIRADFSIKESYEYTAEPPLDVPVTVLSSPEDARAPEEMQERWRDQTTAAFRRHCVPGGHFAVFEQAELAQGYLGSALAQWT
jgi:surfactin synthase thioesterase subunit